MILRFIRLVVCGLMRIRDNPTPAKIDDLIIELQTFCLIEECDE